MIKLPFNLTPGSWGLKGKSYERAKAEYELTGYDLERRLLDIITDEMKSDEYQRRVTELDFKHGRIDEIQYHSQLAILIKDPQLRSLAQLDIQKKKGELSDVEYEKQVATVRGEPWVTVVGMDFSKGSSLEGSFELDWNKPFVEKLKGEGYTGPHDDNIVNAWFMEVCRNIAMEEFDGTGDFTADSAANLEAVMRWNQSVRK